MAGPANLLTEWSALLLGSLADAGVTDVVLSPGSRSTPLVVAAARDVRLRCHDAIDERGAGFFALGQARLTGRPTVLVCTSGTAAAHYLPAVVEASLAFVPVIVLTADRPVELHDTGAAQTVDQVKLLGDHVRWFVDLGAPDAAPAALAGLRRVAAQAVHRSRWPVPGAVHLNFRARKPLEPHDPTTAEERAVAATVAGVRARPVARAHTPVLAPDPAAIAEIAGHCRTTGRGVIVCGPGPVGSRDLRGPLEALARVTGYPLLAEATSQVRFTGTPAEDRFVCDAFDTVLRSSRFRDAHPCDVVIQFGGAPASGGWEQYVTSAPPAIRTVVAPHGWHDPENQATAMLVADPVSAATALVDALGSEPLRPDPSWAEAFAAANRRAWVAVDAEMAGDATALNEGAAVRAVVAGAPRQSTLVLGNSLPVREVDVFAPAGCNDLVVVSQRGANGIDGLIAGAAGTASVSGGPVTLLLGDVSFLHDVGSLALCRDATVPLVLVVLQNFGGRIFEQLPLASAGVPDAVMRHVTTPHDLEFEHAAALFGLPYVRAAHPTDLDKALQAAYGSSGCTVVEAVVPAHGAAEAQRRIAERFEASHP